MKLFPVLLSLLFSVPLARAADSLNPDLQRGLFEEEANQDFAAAIKAYQSVLSAHDDERKLAATALFRLGECYRKLAKTNDAITQYQRLIAEFADQTALANLSRQNLVGLGSPRGSERRPGDSSNTSERIRLLEQALTEQQLSEAIRSRALLKQLTAMSRPELRRVLPTAAPDMLLNKLLEQLSFSERRLTELSSTYTAEHPTVKEARTVIAKLNEQIDERIDGVVNGLKVKSEALTQQTEDLKKELAGLKTAGGATGAIDDAGSADPAARAQLKELLQSEIKIAEQFSAEQRKKVEVGTLARGDQVRFERDVLNLKRQLIAADGLASTEDRTEWRELLLQEIKLAEDATRFEKQKLDSGKAIASEVARLQRDVLILKRELVSFDAAPTPVSSTSGGSRTSFTQRLQAVVNASASGAATDEEEKEIRRIQALIKDSPDLVNASGRDWTPLHQAASKGQLVVARFLLENGANVDQMTSDNKGPALLLAAAQGHKSMVELLLSKGSNPNVKDQSGTTALHEAAAKGFVSVVEVLLANKTDVDPRNSKDETPLHLAVAAGQTAVVEVLLKRGADLNAQRGNGDTPLHFAAARGDTGLIALLLNRKADLNAKNKSGGPPLWAGLDQGHVEAVRALLEKDASTDFIVDGGSPVHRGVARNSIVLVRLLLEHKAQPNLRNRSGFTPLQSVMIDSRNPELVPMLVKAGANPNTPLPESVSVNVRDPKSGASGGRNVGRYPILIAALIQRDLPMVEALLANGAEVNAVAPEGWASSALMYAIYSDSQELVEAVLRHKPDLELKTKQEDRTALYQAVSNGDLKATEALLKAGAKVDALDSRGWTPLHQAAFIGNPEIAGLLLRAPADPNIHALDGTLPLAIARNTSSYPAGATAASRLEVAKLLLQHGADESLLRRRTIAVTRRSRNYERVVFRKSTNDFNRFSLYELIADVYPLQSSEQEKLAFPDLRRIAIERFDGKTGTRQIFVDLEARAAAGSCTNDLWLEWGDRLEIRETEHPLRAGWPGLDGTLATNISQCLGRAVNLVIKGRTNRIELRAGPNTSGQTIVGSSFVNGFLIIHDSFRLAEVLQRSGLLLTSSDLARVQVRRRDQFTGQAQEWMLNAANPDPGTDLWLRDGDVIEVPEKDLNAAPAPVPRSASAPDGYSPRSVPRRILRPLPPSEPR